MHNSHNLVSRLLGRVTIGLSYFSLDKAFFKEAILANLIIALTLIPQFLVVPLILGHWGEAEYSKYIIFLSIINLSGSVNAALQYGFVHCLFIEGKISQNAIFSMAAINLLCFGILCFVLIFFFVFVELQIYVQQSKYLLMCAPFVFLLGSLKTIYQLGFALTAPLIISLFQSVLTVLLLFVASLNLLPLDFSLLALVSLAIASVALFVCIHLCASINRFSFVFDFNYNNFKMVMVFLLKFGGLSFLISLINNFYLNGTKIYLGSTQTDRLLVDFNLAFSLCMISVQFVSPVLGLIFPYLTKLDRKGVAEVSWIVGLHKIYWLLSSLIFSGYLIFTSFVIKIWIGTSYLYLREFVLVLLFYFLLIEGSSIFVQFFKRADNQSNTLIFSFFSFIVIPIFYFAFSPSLDLMRLCLIFNLMGLIFYLCMTISAFCKFYLNSKCPQQLFFDGFVGLSVMFALFWLDSVFDSWVELVFVVSILFLQTFYFLVFHKSVKE